MLHFSATVDNIMESYDPLKFHTNSKHLVQTTPGIKTIDFLFSID